MALGAEAFLDKRLLRKNLHSNAPMVLKPSSTPTQFLTCDLPTIQIFFHLLSVFVWVNAQIIVFLTVTGNRSEGEWSDIGSSRKDASPAAQRPGHKTLGPQHQHSGSRKKFRFTACCTK